VIECKLDTSTFLNNTADARGGGSFVSGPHTLSAVLFRGNRAGIDGGGTYVAAGTSSLTNVIFNNNTLLNSTIGGSEIGMSFQNAIVNVTHGTFASLTAGNGLAISAGTDLPDEFGVQDQAVTLTNVIFHQYDVAVQGQTPTSTVTLRGVLWSTVDTTVTLGNYNIFAQYTGPADFVDEANGDLHLKASSHDIGRGVSAGVAIDFDGYPRFAQVDVGAYQFRHVPPADVRLLIPFVVRE
jgi:hypothetical protein